MRFDGLGHEVAGFLPYTQHEYMAFVESALEGQQTHYDAHCENKAIASGGKHTSIWQALRSIKK